MTVRPAIERDRDGIATVIAQAYRREFSTLSRSVRKIAAALADGIEVQRFFVADRGGDVIGAIACTDHAGRAMRIRAEDWRRHLGLVRGTLAARILAPPFMSRLDYPAGTGYIEFVAVAERARRQGVATKLVEGVIRQTGHVEYVLEVTDVNTSARDCYRKIGFVDFKSEKERFGRLKGFGARIYMRYPR
ncbi:N-acetyltransferase family protein [Mycobacterium sp. MMS18-G62]